MLLWSMDGLDLVSETWFPGFRRFWHPVCAGDVTGDGVQEIILYNARTRETAWLPVGGGGQGNLNVLPVQPVNWVPVSAIDLDGGGIASIIYRNTRTGEMRALVDGSLRVMRRTNGLSVR
jgi:hypothetical protein